VSRPVSSLRNLGPRSDASFARAGIRSAEELIALGPRNSNVLTVLWSDHLPRRLRRVVFLGETRFWP
jgi:hypothetical protein